MKALYVLFAFLFLMTSCTSYKSVTSEKPDQSDSLPTQEEFFDQLSLLDVAHKIEVKISSGSVLPLKYQSHTRDSLYANYNLPKNGFPTVIPLDQIEELKVSKVNAPLTIALTGLWVGFSALMISTLISNMRFGFSF